MGRADKTILVIGATGRQGGATARHLLDDGWRVRALTRDPEKPSAQALAELGAEVVKGDLMDSLSLNKALRGAYGCFCVLTFREFGVEGEKQEGRNLADAAKVAGVEHFVYSSVLGAGEPDSPHPWVQGKTYLEGYIRDAGLPWTVVRPATFMENYLRQASDIVRGVVRGPEVPDTIGQFIAVDDIGRFAALCFADRDCWMHETTLIAGDRMRLAEVAEVFGDVLGREVVYERTEPGPGIPVRPKVPPEIVNLEIVRNLLPGLKTFEDWARTIDWETLAANAIAR